MVHGDPGPWAPDPSRGRNIPGQVLTSYFQIVAEKQIHPLYPIILIYFFRLISPKSILPVYSSPSRTSPHQGQGFLNTGSMSGSRDCDHGQHLPTQVQGEPGCCGGRGHHPAEPTGRCDILPPWQPGLPPSSRAGLDLCCSLNLPHHKRGTSALILRQKQLGSERSKPCSGLHSIPSLRLGLACSRSDEGHLGPGGWRLSGWEVLSLQ